MRTRLLQLAAAAMALATATSAGAQTVQERLDTLEKKVEEQRQGLANALGIDIHGLVAVDYLYDFNKPDSRKDQLILFNEDANSFTLNQANLNLQRNKEDESFGFLMDLDFGKTAEIVGRSTRWDNSFDDCPTPPCDSSESKNSFELRQAYLTYKVPFGDGITLKAGKFVTLAGAEVIKSYNSFNYTVSNSILFGFAIPFTHTGIMASFPMGEYFAADLGLVNGWDDVVDNNDGKSLHAGLSIKPADKFTVYLTGTYGPEQKDNGKSKRALVTALVTAKPLDNLTLILDANWASESDVVPQPDGGLDSALWYGFAGYVIYAPTERLSLTFRTEVFDDSDGVRTGFQQAPFGPGATIWEITPSVTYEITKGLLWRTEYRHDEADKQVFEKQNRVQRGQDTVATELLYAF